MIIIEAEFTHELLETIPLFICKCVDDFLGAAKLIYFICRFPAHKQTRLLSIGSASALFPAQLMFITSITTIFKSDQFCSFTWKTCDCGNTFNYWTFWFLFITLFYLVCAAEGSSTRLWRVWVVKRQTASSFHQVFSGRSFTSAAAGRSRTSDGSRWLRMIVCPFAPDAAQLVSRFIQRRADECMCGSRGRSCCLRDNTNNERSDPGGTRGWSRTSEAMRSFT